VRYRLEWTTPAGLLAAIEPALDEISPIAAQLAEAYNDPRNAPLLGHTEELSEADVIDHYRNLIDGTARPFLFYRDEELAGDGDLRGVEASAGAAELAFLIADPAAQGHGLGTRFAIMLHALAFGPLALERVYASVVPANTASRRVFQKLGYTADESALAQAYADDGDIVLSIDRVTFERLHGAEAAQVRIAPR
jgi:RimJ/RimL family protein N-acetyltransferase